MDWGKGIVLTIIGFVALIMTMVVISVRMDGIELVTENYYELMNLTLLKNLIEMSFRTMLKPKL